MSKVAKKENKQRTHYTEEEVEIILDMFGSYTYETIAKKLGRTPLAIERKLHSLGIHGAKENAGLLSVNYLVESLGSSYKRINKLIEEEGFPVYEKNLLWSSRKRYRKNPTLVIKVDAFWKWCENNRDAFMWTRYKRGSLIPEPEWLDEKIAEIKNAEDYKTREKRFWTINEELQAWDLHVNQGLEQVEVGKILGRTKTSIERKMKNLRNREEFQELLKQKGMA